MTDNALGLFRDNPQNGRTGGFSNLKYQPSGAICSQRLLNCWPFHKTNQLSPPKKSAVVQVLPSIRPCLPLGRGALSQSPRCWRIWRTTVWSSRSSKSWDPRLPMPINPMRIGSLAPRTRFPETAVIAATAEFTRKERRSCTTDDVVIFEYSFIKAGTDINEDSSGSFPGNNQNKITGNFSKFHKGIFHLEQHSKQLHIFSVIIVEITCNPIEKHM